MLALRVVLSAAPPTLVFDEVDAGHRRRGRHRRRSGAGDVGRPAPGAVRHPSRRRSRRSPTRRSWCRRPRSTGARSRGAELLLDDARVGEIFPHARRRRRVGARASPRAASCSATARRPVRRGGAPVRAAPAAARRARSTSRHRRGSTAAPRISSGGSSRATSRSSTTPTSIASRPTALVAAGVGAVVNASPSISGRYPERRARSGSCSAGIPLLDAVGPTIMDQIRDGELDRAARRRALARRREARGRRAARRRRDRDAHGGRAPHDRHRARRRSRATRSSTSTARR